EGRDAERARRRPRRLHHREPQAGRLMENEDHKITVERREKLKALRTKGIAFPNDFRRKDFAGGLHAQWGEQTKEALAERKPPVSVAGRMMLKRVMGK